MKRNNSPYAWIVVYVALANSWLYYVYSKWGLFSGHNASVLEDALTWLACIPQLPSFLVSGPVADLFKFELAGWVITNSIVSSLIYISFTYAWSKRRKRPYSEYA